MQLYLCLVSTLADECSFRVKPKVIIGADGELAKQDPGIWIARKTFLCFNAQNVVCKIVGCPIVKAAKAWSSSRMIWPPCEVLKNNSLTFISSWESDNIQAWLQVGLDIRDDGISNCPYSDLGVVAVTMRVSEYPELYLQVRYLFLSLSHTTHIRRQSSHPSTRT